MASREIMTEMHEESQSEAVGIANTYNYDLALAIRYIRSETATANRHVYAKRLGVWEGTRAEWKSRQISLWNTMKWQDRAVQDFLLHNPQLQDKGYAIMMPRNVAVCDVCKRWIARGKFPIEEARNQEWPAHLNCPHYVETHYRAKADCSEMWVGMPISQWWESLEAGKELGQKGGAGSGNYGHAGRPGLVGGSGGSGGGIAGARRSGRAATLDDKNAGTKFINSASKSGTWLDKDPYSVDIENLDAKADLKIHIVKELSAQSGLDGEFVEQVLDVWTSTSNDSNARAIALQKAAAEEFGVSLSDWQEGKLGLLDEPPVSISEGRQFLRTVYNSTQARLAEQGFKPGDTVTLYRGYKTDNGSEGISVGNIVGYNGNAIESWSSNIETAKNFASNVRIGAVFAMEVPVENIVSTAITGFGVISEYEFVVLGSVPNQTVGVAEVVRGG